MHPKVLARCRALASVALIGTKKKLSKLTCNPVESENDLRIPFKLKRTLALPGRIKIASSAY